MSDAPTVGWNTGSKGDFRMLEIRAARQQGLLLGTWVETTLRAGCVGVLAPETTSTLTPVPSSFRPATSSELAVWAGLVPANDTGFDKA
jgi:hypothetical protein